MENKNREFVYLEQRLACTKDKIYSTLYGTKLIVMSSIVVPQSVLITKETNPKKISLISTYHCSYCSYVGMVLYRILVCILLHINKQNITPSMLQYKLFSMHYYI